MSQHEPFNQNAQVASDPIIEEKNFIDHLDSMKKFIDFTLQINLCYMQFNKNSQEGLNAHKMFDGFFPRHNEKPEFKKDPKSVEFAQRVEDFMNKYVLNNPDYQGEGEQGFALTKKNQEQHDQLMFSALVIMFRVLKTIRLQDQLPEAYMK